MEKKYYTENHNSKFCCDKCYKIYIKENGLIDKENRKKSFNYIYKINDDGSYINKRVGKDEIENYLLKGWIKGRKLL